MATQTYNRSEISKNAWTLVKTQGFTLSKAMKQAWVQAKRKMYVSGLTNDTIIEIAKVANSIDGRLNCYVEGCEIGGSFRGKTSERWKFNTSKMEFVFNNCGAPAINAIKLAVKKVLNKDL